LQNRITAGIISVKKGEKRRLDHISVIESGHPAPDKNSVEAAPKICELAKDATEKDLFICGITGGASSLLVSPVDGISLVDKIHVNELLLKSGAPKRRY
jgi:glycerate 2-kinase